MEFVLAASAIGTAIYMGYASMAPKAARQELDKLPVPIYENSAWYGQGSDANCFNPYKTPVESYIGQFGIPEIFIRDGDGCLTRLTDIGIGSVQW